MEEQLRQIWADVLYLDPEEIGVEDHLFDLGGDSVKAILIMARAAEHQLYFDIQTLYANPTIGTLAKAVSQTDKVNGNRPPIDIHVDDKGDDLLQRIQHQLEGLGIPPARVLKAEKMRDDQVDFIEMTSRGAIGSSSTFLYEVRGPNLQGKLEQAITAVTAKHPMLRTTFVDIDGTYYQVLLAESTPTLALRSGKITEHAHEASTRVLAPGDPTAYFALVEDDGTLLFSFSVLHCFFDGFSRTLVERDLVAALASPDAFAQVPERQWYGDFARHLDANLDETAAETFWRGYLGGSQLETIYQGSAPGPKRRFDRSLCRTVSTAASALQGRQIHLATAITTAWGLALMQRSGSCDVAFTVLTLGRLYPYRGIDALVGLLVKDRPFRLRLQEEEGGGGGIERVLRSVQEDLVAASEYEHGPRFPGGPCVQSYVNIKLGASVMGETEAGGVVVVPRRDLERWESESRYAVYLEVKPVGGGANLFEMRYHSALVDEGAAEALLARFLVLLERIGRESPTTTVANLLASEDVSGRDGTR